MMGYTPVVVLLMLGALSGVKGHGYLLEPPGRSSMWRAGFNTPKNYDDNALFCGGFDNQWRVNRGRCGICGDPYQGPRENEAGGKYATGIISRHYRRGQEVTATVVVTANHLGWFEFKLCPNNNPNRAATQECLDRHVLQLADGSGSKLYIGRTLGQVEVRLRLPADVTCSQCVLQWRYHAANSYGVDSPGRGCVGCGPQEEFYACSDISISDSDSPVGVTQANPGRPAPTVNAMPGFVPQGNVGGQGGFVPAQGGSAIGQGGSAVGQGSSVIGQGGSAIGQGGSAVGQGGSAVGQGSSVIGQGGFIPSQGGFIPSQGGSAVGQGGSAVGQGGSAVGQSGSAVGQGGSDVGQSGSAVGQGGSAVGQAARRCVAISPTWRGNPEMDAWCSTMCLTTVQCPPTLCSCSP